MKDNKLIAEFMGAEPDKKTFFRTGEEVYFYHESWDWLMPVIDKCYQEHMSKHIADAVMTCNIDEAYKVVLEFINEHNKYICGSCGDHVNEVVFNEDTDVDECTNCIQ